MMRATCGALLMDRKSTNELMQMLVITVPFESMVTAAAVRWYGQVLRREKGNFLKEH